MFRRATSRAALNGANTREAAEAVAHATSGTYVPSGGMERPLQPYEVSDALPPPATPDATSQLLSRLYDIVHSADHETLGPYPIGGPDGTYRIDNPFQSLCEYAVFGVTFSGAGLALLSDAPLTQATFGLSSTTILNADPNAIHSTIPQQQGGVFASAGAGTYPCAPSVWTPLAAGAPLFWLVSAGGKSAWVMLAFRRPLRVDGTPAQTIYG